MSLVALGDADGRAAWTLEANGRSLAVFVVDGVPRVTDAQCPHNGGPLVEGVVRDGCVVCPWHWYRFDLRSGVCHTTSRFDLGVYPVLERDGQWYADVSPPPAPRSWATILRDHARGGPQPRSM